jgi:hypothetical protein
MTSNSPENTFIIIRDDRAESPKKITRDRLTIGGVRDCDLWLNDPAISELHAGIDRVEGVFSLTNVGGSSRTRLNDRLILLNERVLLTHSDRVQIGPYRLGIELAGNELTIRVTRQFAPSPGEGELRWPGEPETQQLSPAGRIAEPSEGGDLITQYWSQRKKEKAGGRSDLRPRTLPQHVKARYYWRPSEDLVRPWSFAILTWAFIAILTASTIAARKYKIAFAPASISDPHTRTTFNLTPPIAKQLNSDACFSCHPVGISVTNKEKMHAKCAECHQTESFGPTIIRAHRDAGINCTTCHSEHRGETFKSVNMALVSCAKCHHDGNKADYNGKSVHTPHGGTFGYPVVNGEWIWKGLDSEELGAKPEILAQLTTSRAQKEKKREWLSAQFHAIHIYRVRIVADIDGIEDVDTLNKTLSCKSCHKTGSQGANVDREYPRKTCARCHNSEIFEKTSGSRGMETPSCASCHVQHVKDTHWAKALRIPQNEPAISEPTK